MFNFVKEFYRCSKPTKEVIIDSFQFQLNDTTITVKAVFRDWRLKIYVTINSPGKFHFEMLDDQS